VTLIFQSTIPKPPIRL